MKKLLFPAAFGFAILSALAFKSVKPTSGYYQSSTGADKCIPLNCSLSGSADCDFAGFLNDNEVPSDPCTTPVSNLRKP